MSIVIERLKKSNSMKYYVNTVGPDLGLG